MPMISNNDKYECTIDQELAYTLLRSVGTRQTICV